MIVQRHYTNIGATGSAPIGFTPYKNMTISGETWGKRNKLRAQMDKFTTFYWRGDDAWNNFGAFIINENRTGLKFYNGANYKNSYVQPQFTNSQRILEGITFEGQKISFKVGIYWISEDNLRYFMDWINPYEKNFLHFGFDTDFGYDCKLNGIKDTIRYIIGYEGNEPMYYTELDLSFDVLGENCARSILPWTWQYLQAARGKIIKVGASRPTNYIKTPVVIEKSWSNAGFAADDVLALSWDYQDTTTSLFSITFNTSVSQLWLKYDSESELLLIKFNEDDNYQLLSTTVINDQGVRVIKDFSCNQFFFPGVLDNNYYNISTSYVMRLALTRDHAVTDQGDFTLTTYSRANIL